VNPHDRAGDGFAKGLFDFCEYWKRHIKGKADVKKCLPMTQSGHADVRAKRRVRLN
jgi:hypothetical protein